MSTFNFKEFMQKRANYEGAQGYWKAQTRAWQNCCKTKWEKGSTPQQGWQDCLDEYQGGEGNMGWVGKYANDAAEALKKTAEAGDQMQMGPYWDRIRTRMASGKTPGQAVLETLAECTKEAQNIPEK